MDITEVLFKIVILFAIIAIGYLANRCRILNADSCRMLSRLVICVTLPAYMLSSAMNNVSSSAGSIFLTLGLTLAYYVFLFALAWVYPKLLRIPSEQVGTYRFMLTFANVGFIGFPVTSAILGSESILAATIVNLPFNVLSYTVGVAMVSSKQGVKLNPKLFITAPVISSVLSMIVALLPITFPDALVEGCQLLGGFTTPAGLLIIGSTLADIPLRQLTGSPRLYITCLFRLVLIPLLVWAVLRPFVEDRIILGVLVLLAGMPAATNGTMICLTYGGDQKLISQGTFLTTLLSLLTIPLMALLLQI